MPCKSVPNHFLYSFHFHFRHQNLLFVFSFIRITSTVNKYKIRRDLNVYQSIFGIAWKYNIIFYIIIIRYHYTANNVWCEGVAAVSRVSNEIKTRVWVVITSRILNRKYTQYFLWNVITKGQCTKRGRVGKAYVMT